MPMRGCSRKPSRTSPARTRQRWFRATSGCGGSGSRRPSRKRVFVLSRITLGADVAVTSVILDAAKRRFPAREITLAGPRKNYELFAGDPRIGHAPIDYVRGGLRERFAAAEALQATRRRSR